MLKVLFAISMLLLIVPCAIIGFILAVVTTGVYFGWHHTMKVVDEWGIKK